MNTMTYKIGVDIGGTTMSAGILDKDNNIIFRKGVKTFSNQGTEKVLERVVQMLTDLLKESKIDVENIESIGVGCPGEMDASRKTVTFSNNLGWINVPLKKYLEDKLKLPVSIENDANCAALGEYVAGAGQKYNSVIMVTLGTGVGGSLVLDKKLFRGCSGCAGIIGHIAVDLEGLDCNCGRKGCWEAYASVGALVRQATQKAEENKESLLNKILLEKGNLSGKTIFDAAKQGDKAAKEVLNQYVKYLSVGFVSLVNIFDPDVIIVGGGISREGDFLLQPVREIVQKEKYCKSAKQANIIASKLGNDAGLIGAASLNEF